jgi:CRISPR-associated endonuclease Csn1
MKKILGLDLGTTSIGWALVNEAEKSTEQSSIIKLGVRVNPLTTDEQSDFEKGNSITTNANRTLSRGARRNLQRYKLRRDALIQLMVTAGFITNETKLAEDGKGTTHETLRIRSKSATERIELEELARVLIAINRKRGYKSSRKSKVEDDGSSIDGMATAKILYEENLTPGQFVYQLLKDDKRHIPDFYQSDLKKEFELIWDFQSKFNPTLDTILFGELKDKNKTQTWAILAKPLGLVGIKLEGNTKVQKLKKYELRSNALTERLSNEELAIVLQEINNTLKGSSGYLGAISDRSKELFFNKETVGQNLYKQIHKNFHTSLKNQVFYRQDYLDEFEQIWETQKNFHATLTDALKQEVRDVIIFYQRKLKSQKHLISNCQFEMHHKAVPKSSPLFQEFKIWQVINNLEFKNTKTGQISSWGMFDDEVRISLFQELNIRGDFSHNQVLKFLGLSTNEWQLNYTEGILGNETNKALYNVYQTIAENEGYGFDWNKKNNSEIKEELNAVFDQIGIKSSVLNFNSLFKGNEFDKQDSYRLWHLIYSAEDDGKISQSDNEVYGDFDVKIKKGLQNKFGFDPVYGALLANISLQQDYGQLSAKAIKKILPHLQNGNDYAESCKLANYRHSNFLTKEEQETRKLKTTLDLVKKNSLRNPVVEKILNQMVNLINQLGEEYGKPDEIRIELARELKKSAKERSDMTSRIASATKVNNSIRAIITKEFGIPNPTKNDIIRYKLWEELAPRGYKSIFKNTYIPKDKIFSKDIDIEHIIPKALLFDDSFSNKTLAYRSVNLKKSDRTAYDFISEEYHQDLESYVSNVEAFYNKGKGVSKAKRDKLLMTKAKLPEGFIERDLRNSQYIAKKAKQMLQEYARGVVATSGNITAKLRNDWDLVNVMKELNFEKYKVLGLTEVETRKDNKEVEVIKDWSKRNDHRHHAMDALTVAFTTNSHIQYINNLSASRDEKNLILYGIRQKITTVDKHTEGGRKRSFISPILNFRQEAKTHLQSVLISFKAKNKVVTRNVNKTKTATSSLRTLTLTPRGQLHKETVYAKRLIREEGTTKFSIKFDLNQAQLIVNPEIKHLVINRLSTYNNNSSIAFSAKELKNNPILYKNLAIKETTCFEEVYTIRKDINPTNFSNEKKIEKIIDVKTRALLMERFRAFDNDSKNAFSDLDTNPIWLNEGKGIQIKRVTLKGVNNVEALHTKVNHLGESVVDENGRAVPSDFVSTGNNHHVAIYQDSTGELNERVISFYEAVERAAQKLPVVDIDYNKNLGWKLIFTMKQNEMFVFPSDDFNPSEIDLLDQKNISLISKNLYRVQKIASRNYVFRHHLETTVDDVKILRDITWKMINSTKWLKGLVKVRLNHIGKIVVVGEYK